VSYRPGDERTVAVTVTHGGEQVVTYETNSRPWEEGIVQVRNVVAMNLDGYDRAELIDDLEAAVRDNEAALRALYE
jgi:hypothetical protein